VSTSADWRCNYISFYNFSYFFICASLSALFVCPHYLPDEEAFLLENSIFGAQTVIYSELFVRSSQTWGARKLLRWKRTEKGFAARPFLDFTHFFSP
jgi:hypothetical protein